MRVYLVFLKFETHLENELRTNTGSFHGILKCNRKSRRVDVMDSGIPERSTPAAHQSNSFCLEIDYFRKNGIW